ncbi:hypothetical protein KQX54_015564 [Cotesia glomerata]|uniref:Uncharacterized protein n=1 Tax=Cotesia glomerata TaxID=32391 RepID=A0AAV7I7M9_COTGL|nr:hypothetical protein KQX54_015564 [Cotesia glomerata]
MRLILRSMLLLVFTLYEQNVYEEEMFQKVFTNQDYTPWHSRRYYRAQIAFVKIYYKNTTSNVTRRV